MSYTYRYIPVILLAAVASISSAQSRLPSSSGQSIEQYRAYALVHQGDASRGRILFADEQRLACSRCHAVNGTGAKVGPDLGSIGDKFGRQELIESILSPSASIAVGYSTTLVKTRSGEIYAGIIREANASGIAIMQADGKLMRIAAVEIARQKTTDISLMPEGLHSGLSLADFADLIAYLASLKAPQAAAATEHGMPAVIPELEHPVRLIPFPSESERFEHPVWFGPVPGLDGAFAVVEHETGRIWLVSSDPASGSKTIFLDTGRYQQGTRGLLGLVFHPRFAANRRYFIMKHVVRDGRFASLVLEGAVTSDLRKDSGKGLRTVMTLDAVTNVHYGGCMQFGPDGYLYIGMGDTGPQGDPEGHAQNLGLLLGKMLRIDVDRPQGDEPYAVPSSNPFVGRSGARPEIWAYGLREPWRFSFDPLTGDLWAGDVGQDLFEEVDIIRRGENYGWNVYEGFQPFSNRYRRDGEKYVPPVFAYTRKYGASVTGGYVYRADSRSSFYGVYVFGDYQNSRVFGLTREGRALKKVRLLVNAPQHVVSFGRDSSGQLYVVGYEGTIYRLDLQHAGFDE